jgi:hypothetical protein
VAIRYVNDAPTLADGFGTTIAGDQVARMALEAATPFTLGVTGKWGAGKTSVLRRAFVTLKGNPVRLAVPLGEAKEDVGKEDWRGWAYDAANRNPSLGWSASLKATAESSLCVWYSPWQHQSASNPLIPLLLEIRAQYTAWIKLKKGAQNINRRGGLAGLALLERVVDAAAGIALSRSVKMAEGTSEAVRKAWREAAPAEPDLGDGQRFHLLFEDAVETLLDGLQEGKKKTGGRLIVFIDDLDRCEESVIVQLLESIKLYLGSPRCVFILAIDENAVLAALERHWEGRPEDANREYLEKLFQAIVPVPVPRRNALCEFLQEQLTVHGFPDPEGCAGLVAELLEPNPRKVKNFVNSACACWGLFRHAEAVAGGDNSKHRDFARRFLLFHYLRVQHKPVWRLLERQPWSLRILTKVLTGAADQMLKLPEPMASADQRLLEHLLVRSFAHVLKDDGGMQERHRHLPISEAVDLFQQRIDRKRSDELFIRHYRDLVDIAMDLPEELLHLPEPKLAV